MSLSLFHCDCLILEKYLTIRVERNTQSLQISIYIKDGNNQTNEGQVIRQQEKRTE